MHAGIKGMISTLISIQYSTICKNPFKPPPPGRNVVKFAPINQSILTLSLIIYKLMHKTLRILTWPNDTVIVVNLTPLVNLIV